MAEKTASLRIESSEWMYTLLSREALNGDSRFCFAEGDFRMPGRIAIAIAACLMTGAALRAQTEAATLRGVVHDASQAVVP